MCTETTRLDKKVSPPILKGQRGEKPDSYLLKANDGLDNNRTLEYEKSHDFRYNLDDMA